jgi:hypothetical protein
MKIDPRLCSTIPAFAFRGVRHQMALHALLDHDAASSARKTQPSTSRNSPDLGLQWPAMPTKSHRREGQLEQDNEKMKRTDHCGQVHWNLYKKSDKANAFDNQNADFQEGYAWGIETFAYHSQNVLDAEIEFRGEFKLTDNGFSEFKRGFFAARSQMAAAGIKKRRLQGDPFQ